MGVGVRVRVCVCCVCVCVLRVCVCAACVCVCVCVCCVCVCVCVCVCCVCMCVCVLRVCVCAACVCVCVCVLRVCVCVCVCVLRVRVRVCAACACACVCTPTHMHSHTCMSANYEFLQAYFPFLSVSNLFWGALSGKSLWGVWHPYLHWFDLSLSLSPSPLTDIRGINAVIPHSVFISYYPEPKNRVFNSCLQRLVDEVRSYGLTVYFDAACSGKELRQYGGKNRWKEVFMQKADTIVLICTPKLFKEDLSLSNPNKQRRLFATSNIHVDLRLLRSIAMHRIIPVLLGDESAANCIPFYFKGQNFQRWPSEDFMYCIARVPKYEPRPVLKKKILRPKVINYPQARNWNPFDG